MLIIYIFPTNANLNRVIYLRSCQVVCCSIALPIPSLLTTWCYLCPCLYWPLHCTYPCHSLRMFWYPHFWYLSNYLPIDHHLCLYCFQDFWVSDRGCWNLCLPYGEIWSWISVDNQMDILLHHQHIEESPLYNPVGETIPKQRALSNSLLLHRGFKLIDIQVFREDNHWNLFCCVSHQSGWLWLRS